MKELKKLMQALKIAEMNANKADAAWDMNPESAELEEQADKAYQAQHEALEELAACIVKVTAGKVDQKTARTMIYKKRDELEALIAKVA